MEIKQYITEQIKEEIKTDFKNKNKNWLALKKPMPIVESVLSFSWDSFSFP